MSSNRAAVLYRMVLPDHTCPFGVSAKQLLEQHGFEVENHVLGTREEVETFKDEQSVTTTPLVFTGGERIGGSDDLERYLRAGG